MNKAKINYAVDCCLFVLLATSFITSRVRELRQLHELSGNLLVLLVGIHLLLHWRWIVSMTKNLFTKKEIADQ